MSVKSVNHNRVSGTRTQQDAKQAEAARDTSAARGTQSETAPKPAESSQATAAAETQRATAETQNAARTRALETENQVRVAALRTLPTADVSTTRGLTAADAAQAPILRRGARGPEVSALQTKLNQAGANLEVDGVFGPQTENAVRRFQRDAGLSPDRIVGPKTHAVLHEATQRSAAAPVNETRAAAETPVIDRNRVLRAGAEGPEVRDLQRRLNAQGYNVVADGKLGLKTARAVLDFQNRSGLHADGIFGTQTQRALEAAERQNQNLGAAAAPRGDAAALRGDAADAAPPTGNVSVLQRGQDGPAVQNLQERLNGYGYSLEADGDYGPATQSAVRDFQERVGLMADGVVGPTTFRAMDEVDAGTRQLREPPISTNRKEPSPGAALHRDMSVGANSFRVTNQTREELGRHSVPGDRKIAMDANSGGRNGEILRPLVVIPNNATPAERAAAQQAADRIAQWFDANLPGERASTGLVRTTAENNNRGIGGFFHTEFHSVHDHDAVNLIKQNPETYARLLGETLGQIPGANFIVPHGREGRWGRDPGAVSFDGKTSEIGLARHVIEQGFFNLP